jgi:hypothetical protein
VKSVASPNPRRREARTRPGCELDDRHDPNIALRIDELIEPGLVVAIDRIMRPERNE